MVKRGMGTSCDWLATALATFSEVMNEVAFFFNTLSTIFSISLFKPLTFESEFPQPLSPPRQARPQTNAAPTRNQGESP